MVRQDGVPGDAVPVRDAERAAALAELLGHVKAGLGAWHERSEGDTSLSHLRIFKLMQRDMDDSPRLVANQLLLNGLTALEIEDERYGKLLRARFVDKLTAYASGSMLNIAESTAYVTQRLALERLTELLFEMERQAQDDFVEQMARRMDVPMQSYWVGLEEPIDALCGVLQGDGPPWIVSIEGLGGIGKTTLAGAVTQKMLGAQGFDDFGWSTARQARLDPSGQIVETEAAEQTVEGVIDGLFAQFYSEEEDLSTLTTAQKVDRLQVRLQQTPHLVVIDNLETIEDLDVLAPMLKRFVNPSKILVTTRERYYADAGVYRYGVQPLSLADTIALIRTEARVGNLPHVIESSDADLEPIYEIVGGNPLALRLVVGQIYMHSLNTILENLAQAQGEKAANLYTYIYRSAWDALDEAARRVLLAMPMVTDAGGDLGFLAATSGLDSGAAGRSLDELMRLNLVDGVGGLNDRRYLIHSLTRTFLLEQVGKWGKADQKNK